MIFSAIRCWTIENTGNRHRSRIAALCLRERHQMRTDQRWDALDVLRGLTMIAMLQGAGAIRTIALRPALIGGVAALDPEALTTWN
jgi:uncharacterized membrane protein